MSRIILTFLIAINSFELMAQSEDSGLVYYFKHNPGSLVVLIGFAVLTFVIKPIYYSIKKGISSEKSMPLIELTVAEEPFIIFTKPMHQIENNAIYSL